MYGFDAFRAGQEEIVRRAVGGRDTLALMPTGAGKSLCYQLAAMLRPTPTLVLSPLIALMKDQLDKLPVEVARQASLINSSLASEEAAQRLRAMAAGRYKLIYAAPERLRQRQFVAALRSVQVGLVVIDEVHCVSMWGHDFRPDYLFIRAALETLGDPVVLGLTATATPITERDIAGSLGRELEVVRSSVVRPNLRYEVIQVENEEERRRVTVARARSLQGSGIIYARSREKCEQIARLLQRNGVRAMHYHAGLEAAERAGIQEKFQRGSARVIVATIAFGMGIDKPDIRWVLLYNYPSSLESYVQMVGRAGRDGQPSVCMLLAGNVDATSVRRFARADIPAIEQLREVYRQLHGRMEAGWAEVTPEELAVACRLEEDHDPRVLVGMLERAGLVRRGFDAGRAMCIEITSPPPDARRRIEQLLARYEQQALERANRMIAFGDSSLCLHQQVARHFGESIATPCGMCNVCSPGPEQSPTRPEEARPLPDDIAQAILDAVEALSWPLGQRGLAATLQGSIDAPPSAQRSKGFGLLAAAPPSRIKRWIGELVESGHLEPFESADGFGFKLLRVAKRDALPPLTYLPPEPAKRKAVRTPDAEKGEALLTKADEELFERLRVWRLERSRAAALRPFMVMHDRVLRQIAARRPLDLAALLAIPGMGPGKIEQYGDEILSVVKARRP